MSVEPVAAKMKLFQSAFVSIRRCARRGGGFSMNRATVREPYDSARPGTMYPSSGSASSGAMPMSVSASGLWRRCSARSRSARASAFSSSTK